PIAYLTGFKEFFSLPLYVDEAVLIPRPETEILVERTIHLARHVDRPVRRILDLGTGSGCIAVALAVHLPDAQIAASDISDAAIAVARRNAETHGVADRIDLRTGDLFAPWRDSEPFDVILSNPPYVAERDASSLPRNVREFEPDTALFGGADGMAIIRRIADEASEHLATDGDLMIEIAYDQASAARSALDAAGWGSIVSYRDLARHERVLHARRAARTFAIEG
ncbi:MAG: peptide chain release factor N(5)-glutamine methyltransferase, partial [Planctomycetota bacterium]